MVKSGIITVEGLKGVGNIGENGVIDKAGINMLKQSGGRTVILEVKYTGPDGTKRIASRTYFVRKDQESCAGHPSGAKP